MTTDFDALCTCRGFQGESMANFAMGEWWIICVVAKRFSGMLKRAPLPRRTSTFRPGKKSLSGISSACRTKCRFECRRREFWARKIQRNHRNYSAKRCTRACTSLLLVIGSWSTSSSCIDEVKVS